MKPSAAHFFGFALGSVLCLLTAGNVQAADKPKAPAAPTNAAPVEVAPPAEEKSIILINAVFENPMPGSKLIDPFFPASQRPPYKPVEVIQARPTNAGPGKVEVDCYKGITLKGVSSFGGGRLLAIINQVSMEKGEIANVKTIQGTVIRIEVVEIKDKSAIIRAIETKQGNEIIDLKQQCNPKEIFLQQQQ